MKFLLKFFKWFAIVLASIIILMYIFDVDYLLRAVRTIYFKGYTTAFLEDYKEFPNREIKKGTLNLGQLLLIITQFLQLKIYKKPIKNYKLLLISSLKMIAFGTKVILMDLIKTRNPIPFPWQKVWLLWQWEKLLWKEKSKV